VYCTLKTYNDKTVLLVLRVLDYDDSLQDAVAGAVLLNIVCYLEMMAMTTNITTAASMNGKKATVIGWVDEGSPSFAIGWASYLSPFYRAVLQLLGLFDAIKKPSGHKMTAWLLSHPNPY
jgi:hypothetical protein